MQTSLHEYLKKIVSLFSGHSGWYAGAIPSIVIEITPNDTQGTEECWGSTFSFLMQNIHSSPFNHLPEILLHDFIIFVMVYFNDVFFFPLIGILIFCVLLFYGCN